MLVHPPAEGFFRRESWSLEGNTRLAVRGRSHLVRILVIDADAHDIEAHHRAQLGCEKPEEFLRRANGVEGLRNAEERFVSLTDHRLGCSLSRSAHHSRLAPTCAQ